MAIGEGRSLSGLCGTHGRRRLRGIRAGNGCRNRRPTALRGRGRGASFRRLGLGGALARAPYPCPAGDGLGVLALSRDQADQLVHRHIGRAFRHHDLGEHALIDRLDLHRRLVGLDLGDHIAGLDGVALLLQPFGEIALLHRGREGGHEDVGGHLRTSVDRARRAEIGRPRPFRVEHIADLPERFSFGQAGIRREDARCMSRNVHEQYSPRRRLIEGSLNADAEALIDNEGAQGPSSPRACASAAPTLGCLTTRAAILLSVEHGLRRLDHLAHIRQRELFEVGGIGHRHVLAGDA